MSEFNSPVCTGGSGSGDAMTPTPTGNEKRDAGKPGVNIIQVCCLLLLRIRNISIYNHVHVDCLGCAVLLCLVCLFDLACFFLSSFSSLI